MRARAIALNTLTSAISNANANTGGNRVFLGEQTYNVRSLGLIRTQTDIGDIVVTEAKDKSGAPTGNPIRVRDIANVVIGYAPRLGMVGKSGGCPLELHTQSWWDRLWESPEERAERERLDNPPGQRNCVASAAADEPDVVQGIILMRYRAQPNATPEGI